MKIIAPAKLNLFLHITGRRDDGYHLLESLFVFTSFGDEITITSADTISLTINGPFASIIACEKIEKNLVYRAALLLQKKYAVKQGAHIILTKNIPVGAGLGGGSSDAAAVLKALNQFWQLQIDSETLATMGLSLGADIPACIVEKPALVFGIGDQVTPIAFPFSLSVLLINPNKSLSTPMVFQAYKETNTPFSASEHINRFEDLNTLFAFLKKTRNDLEAAAIQLQPDIQIILSTLKQNTRCELARMSGSGATCFALFRNHDEAQSAEKLLKKQFPHYWIFLSEIKNGHDSSRRGVHH